MMIPTREYRRYWLTMPEALPTGLDRVAQGWSQWLRRRGASNHQLRRRAESICEQAKEMASLTDRKLEAGLGGVSAWFRRYPDKADQELDRALALVCAAAGRTMGMTPYPVQVMGALAMHQGGIAEMATGEGKTLTAALPAVLAGWSSLPCHVLTVNDYLAERDAQLMEPLYRFCGLSVGAVLKAMTPEQRRRQYEKRIVYTTCHELLADFLRDRIKAERLGHPARQMLRSLVGMTGGAESRLVLRGLDTVIVDEADSILIDEAVTPLIISAKKENRVLAEAVTTAHRIVGELEDGRDFVVNQKLRSIDFTARGLERLHGLRGRLKGVWASPARSEELLRQALSARAFFSLGKDYVIQEGVVVIVDERTGRLQPDRTWSNGLHQAVEAKEGLEITHPTDTLASLSFQRFFRLFRKLSGMTGTGREVAAEFAHIYKTNLVPIPTHRPCIRRILPESVFTDQAGKLDAVVAEVVACHAQGRPVLVGTRTVRDSERLAGLLEARGVPFDLLNAVHHKEEAAIVARAGRWGAVTIATNMAGRGTDIKLEPRVRELGGLHVISIERNDSKRVDRQLYGRCARQGDPGSAHGYVSVDDELLTRFLPAAGIRLLQMAKARDLPGADRIIRLAFDHAERRATHLAFRARTSVLKHDTFMGEALSFAGSSL